MRHLRKFADFLQRRFQVVILWGLRDDGPPPGEMTCHEIEAVFSDGCATAVNDEHTGRKNDCPYADGTLARHWWTRGYAHYCRTFRALKAEELLKVETARATDLEARHMVAWSRAEEAERSLYTLKQGYTMKAGTEGVELLLAEAKLMKATSAARRLITRLTSDAWLGQACAAVVRQQARAEMADVCYTLGIEFETDKKGGE